MMFDRSCLRAAVCLTIVLWTGCSTQPEAVKAPPIQPAAAADAAFAAYDKSADGNLSSEELTACPGLKAALPMLDKNNDRSVSQQELVDRLQMWVGSGIGVSVLTLQVTQNGLPLEGASIRLVPEAFFGDAIQPATGVTGASGAAQMAIDASNLPQDLQQLRGVQQGIYRVEITHPAKTIRPEYNTATTLGLDVSFDAGRNFVTIPIK